MVYQISVTIKDEFVRDCLDKEQNKSGLITSLLHDYYKSKITGYMSKEQISDYKQKLERDKSRILNEQNALTNAEKQLLNEQTQKDNNKELEQLRQVKLREDRIKTFANFLEHFFILEEGEAGRLARIYEDETNKNTCTLFEFGESMQLIPRPENDREH